MHCKYVHTCYHHKAAETFRQTTKVMANISQIQARLRLEFFEGTSQLKSPQESQHYKIWSGKKY